MKLAEALLLRDDMQKKLASLNSRIAENVKVQKDEEPIESPEWLIIEVNRVIGELYSLTYRIQKTNSIAVLASGKTMLMTLLERDELTERHCVLVHAIKKAKTEPQHYEIKWKRTVCVVGLQKQADDIAEKISQLNIAIQKANWHIDLLN